MKSVQRLGGVELGLDTDGVVAIELNGSAWWRLEPEEARVQWDEVMASLGSAPGVEALGAINYVPLGGGYYVPTSTGDNVVQKHACVVDRAAMLRGDFEDDGIYVWQFHVDWDDPAGTTLIGPEKIDVAPYHYLCDGQLTNCVRQSGTDRHLDSQGDKIVARLVYRNLGDRESVVAVHSVATGANAGGGCCVADQHAALGGLHADRRGSFGRLHDLVGRGLPEGGGGELLDSDWGVQAAGGCGRIGR